MRCANRVNSSVIITFFPKLYYIAMQCKYKPYTFCKSKMTHKETWFIPLFTPFLADQWCCIAPLIRLGLKTNTFPSFGAEGVYVCLCVWNIFQAFLCIFSNPALNSRGEDPKWPMEMRARQFFKVHTQPLVSLWILFLHIWLGHQTSDRNRRGLIAPEGGGVELKPPSSESKKGSKVIFGQAVWDWSLTLPLHSLSHLL